MLVLHRLIPPRASLAEGPAGVASAIAKLLSEPRAQTRDGLRIDYLPYVSPPRDRSYPAWGAWAAPPLGLALRRLRRSFPFDLLHAHNAVPAADAVRRALGRRADPPMVVSVHGGDVLSTAVGDRAGAAAVARGLGAARLVLANSQGIAELSAAHGARRDARGAPRDRPTQHSAPAAGGWSSEAGHGGASDRAQAPRRRPARPGGARAATPHPALRDRRRRPRADCARRARRPPGGGRAGRVPRATAAGAGDRAGAAVHPLRDALDRGGLRRGLRRGDGRRRARDRVPGRARAGGDRRRRRRLGARASRRHRAADPAHRRAPVRPPRLREAGQRARATVAAHFTWERCGTETLAAYEHALR